jgi:hypothetical protein
MLAGDKRLVVECSDVDECSVVVVFFVHIVKSLCSRFANRHREEGEESLSAYE